jgi:hypothetical protein
MKNKKLAAITFTVIAATCCGSSSADVGMGVRAGTAGAGVDLGFSLVPTLAARVGYSEFSINKDVNSNDANYDGKLKLSNFNALLDWSPLGPFRLTGGLVGDNNKINITGKPQAGQLNLNGTNYDTTQLSSVTGTIKSKNSVAPYLGVGFGNVSGAGINFYSDFGAMFQGGAKSTLTATCGSAAPTGSATCNQIQANVAGEQISINNKISGFKIYPVVSIGMTIGF